MKTSATGRQLIEQYEGLILGAYDDYNDKIVSSGDKVRGTLTIGYGHTSSAGGIKVYAGQKITKQQADDILAGDLGRVEADVSKYVKVPLNQNQYDAIVSFHFNTGALGKSTCSVTRNLNKKDYKAAADSLLLYNKGNGQVLAGLTRRRNAERTLFLKPYVAPATSVPIVAAGTIAAGTAASFGHHHSALIIAAGALFLAALCWGSFRFYEFIKNRKTTNVG